MRGRFRTSLDSKYLENIDFELDNLFSTFVTGFRGRVKFLAFVADLERELEAFVSAEHVAELGRGDGLAVDDEGREAAIRVDGDGAGDGVVFFDDWPEWGFGDVADGEGALDSLDEFSEEGEGIGVGVVDDLEGIAFVAFEGIDGDFVAEVAEEEVEGVGGAGEVFDGEGVEIDVLEFGAGEGFVAAAGAEVAVVEGDAVVGWGGFSAVGALALAGHGRVILFFSEVGRGAP